MAKKTWITTDEAAELYGCSQRYITMLVTGRTRRKNDAVWVVKPKLKNIKTTISAKGKLKYLVDKQELEQFLNNSLEKNNV
jgi:hypothetical protein